MSTPDADFRPDLKDPDLYLGHAPHEVFARLRREAPVYWNPETDGAGFWALSRHADIVEASRQPELFSSAHANGGHRIFNENEVGLTNAGDSGIGIPAEELESVGTRFFRASNARKTKRLTILCHSLSRLVRYLQCCGR